jgi:esterase/lipase superfamily enzyme
MNMRRFPWWFALIALAGFGGICGCNRQPQKTDPAAKAADVTPGTAHRLRDGVAQTASPAAMDVAPAPAGPAEATATPSPSDTTPAAEATTALAQNDYTLVKIYYGTDRALVNLASLVPAWVSWLSWTLGCAGVAMILAAVAYRYHPTGLMRTLLVLAGGSAILFTLGTSYAVWQGRLEAEQTQETDVVYGTERGEMQLGTCAVAIPKDHRFGKLQTPAILQVQFQEDPHHHVALLDVQPQSVNAFYADMKACVDHSQQKGVFVFVHGFNVKFADAARRTAQIAYDLQYDGAPILYSWPSQGSLTEYTVDETNVEWTVSHLKQFLLDVASRSGAKQIHLIAHSMGNRALTSALRYLAYEPVDKRPKFREVILTAPDVDAELFKRDIAPAIIGMADRVTLYASSNDEALRLSKEVHGYPRAGDTDDQLVIVPGVDTIDVSAVDTSFLGHSYYVDSHSVVADLFELLHAKTPEQRQWLREEYHEAMKYWVFLRGKTAKILR